MLIQHSAAEQFRAAVLDPGCCYDVQCCRTVQRCCFGFWLSSQCALLQNNGESESAEVPVKPVIKKKRLIWDIQIDPDDADMAGASEEAIKMMTQSRRVS